MSQEKIRLVLNRLHGKQGEEIELIRSLNSLNKLIQPKPNSKEETDARHEVMVLLKKSSVTSVISTHLRNDSVLDIASHVPLYRAILQLLRTIAAVPQFWSLLVATEGDSTISGLLVNLRSVVIQYSQLLEASKVMDCDFAQLVSDVEATATKVEEAVKIFTTGHGTGGGESLPHIAPFKTPEETYMEEMRKLQFAFQEILRNWNIPYHFKWEARRNLGVQSRAKRLAQESITLSTSLPLSYGSSIFMRYDHDRLDIIKVLITGAAGTPYSNGCFELDVFLPSDYPNSPPKVHFVTAKGRPAWIDHVHSDGSICLTLLNTWDGSPEERWDPNKSTLLPVLVAIQSFILVEEWWHSEGTKAQKRHQTVKFAMLEQIKNPSVCFKEAILRHFWMKKDEILAQCEQWYNDSNGMDMGTREVFKHTLSALKLELQKMSPPAGLETPSAYHLNSNVSDDRGTISDMTSGGPKDFKSDLIALEQEERPINTPRNKQLNAHQQNTIDGGTLPVVKNERVSDQQDLSRRELNEEAVSNRVVSSDAQKDSKLPESTVVAYGEKGRKKDKGKTKCVLQ